LSECGFGEAGNEILKRTSKDSNSMHQLLIGSIFIAMVLAPAMASPFKR